MALPDILYKGVPRGAARGATAEVVKRVRPERVVIPCVGAFALAQTVVETGVVRPEQIEGCDITLYSSVIGAMLAREPFRLEALGRFEFLNDYWGAPTGLMERSLRQVAAVAWGIRVCQYEGKRDSLYMRERLRELWERKLDYLEQARLVAAGVRLKLQGLRYTLEDMDELLGRHGVVARGGQAMDSHDEEGTLILCNPPRYDAGYEKMFRGVEEVFDWDDPRVEQFGEREYPHLLERLACGPRTLVYYATPTATAEDPAEEWGPPWRSVFADRPRAGKGTAINWVTTNRIVDEPKLKRADVEPTIEGKYKLFKEERVTPASDLRVIVESREVVSYYRDLLVHRLALVNAERYKLLMIDGELLGCVGVHLQNLRASGVMNGVAKLVFAMSVDNPNHKFLHKLTLMSVCSSWFWKDEISDIEPLPRAVQTTMLTRFPEVKTARGIFTLKGREVNKKTGEFKLTYYSDVKERSARQTVEEWLRRWGER